MPLAIFAAFVLFLFHCCIIFRLLYGYMRPSNDHGSWKTLFSVIAMVIPSFCRACCLLFLLFYHLHKVISIIVLYFTCRWLSTSPHPVLTILPPSMRCQPLPFHSVLDLKKANAFVYLHYTSEWGGLCRAWTFVFIVNVCVLFVSARLSLSRSFCVLYAQQRTWTGTEIKRKG